MENIVLYSSRVFLSETDNPDSYIAKFVICDFGRNENGVALNRNTIDDWMSTLKNKPLVGKFNMINAGEYDFTGHNMKVVKKIDAGGNEYQEVEFDTEAFGTFTDVAIEEVDGVECIVATCEIWKRFSKACEIIVRRIEEGTLHTSWEISTVNYTQQIINGLITKVINAGRFIGHCLLGKNVSPAYKTSGLLEIASTEYDVEFAEALSQDMLSESLNKSKEGSTQELMKKEKTNEVAEKDVDIVEEVAENLEPTEATIIEQAEENAENAEITDNSQIEEVTTSQLTEYDLRKKIREACRAKLGDWCYITYHFPANAEVWVEVDGRESELDFARFTYTVNGDNVEVSEPENVKLTVSVSEINTTISELNSDIESKTNLLIKASEEITVLKSEISELKPFKEEFEKAEQERIIAEKKQQKESLISEITKSGFITKEEIEASEEFKKYVEELDAKSLKAVVAERLIASLDKHDEVVETSSVGVNQKPSTNLNIVEDELDAKSLMKNYLGGK